jgi:hypothetical protein
MRRGKAYGCCHFTPRGLATLSRWDEPLPGWGMEVFRLVCETELVVESSMTMGGTTVSYNTVYVRKR